MVTGCCLLFLCVDCWCCLLRVCHCLLCGGCWRLCVVCRLPSAVSCVLCAGNARRSLFVTRWLLAGVCRALCVVCCLRCVFECLVCVVRCLMAVVWCLLSVCCLMLVGCRLLFAVRCALLVGW